MSSPESFSDKVKTKISKLQSVEEERVRTEFQLADEQRKKSIRIAQLLAERRRADALFKGDRPEDIFGEEGAKLCRDFLTTMEAHNYPRSHKLLDPTKSTHTEPKFIEAYRIGYAYPVESSRVTSVSNQVRSISLYGNWATVYLCADGYLRSEGVRNVPGAVGIPLDSTTGERYAMTPAINMYQTRGYHGAEDDRHTETSLSESIIEQDLETVLLEIAAGALST
jgi:hypothetical protein